MNNPPWHSMPADRAMKELDTGTGGLSPSQALSRLKKFGPNEILGKSGPGPLSIFISQFRSFLIAILIGATIFSAAIGEMIDAIAIIAIVLISACLGFFQEYKAEKTMAALRRMTAQEAVVIRGGKETRIPSRLLVPGDVVVIDEGSKMPADMRILESVEIRVDESCLTGESTPVSKDKAPVETRNLADMKSMLWSGTTIEYGRGRGVVTATGMSTQIGRIAHMVQKAGEEFTPLQRKLDSFSKKLGMLILAICAAVVVLGVIRMGPMSGAPVTEELLVLMVMTGIALAVAAIPEGLPIVVTVTLALGVQRLSRHNSLMRKLPAVEALGSTTVICSDKTGTLTKNEMTVTAMWHSGKCVEVTGRGYAPRGEFLFGGRPVHVSTDTTLRSMLYSASLCSNAQLVKEAGAWSVIGDPTEASLMVAAAKAGISQKETSRHERIREFPFSSERMMMSVICRREASRETRLHAKGAPEVILSLSTHTLRNGRRVRLTGKDRKAILDANHRMTSRALRVLAIATREVKGDPSQKQAESGLTFIGLAGMIDPPRDGVKEDIGLCRKAGIKVVMITGDHKNTAVAIARQLEIGRGDVGALTGDDLDGMSDAKLASLVQGVSVYARVSPEHKVRILEALKSKGHIIAMTGDGVNDAPALKKADIGIAMGIKGTDVSKEASDMILRDDNFSSIVLAVKEGRGIYDNIKKFIQYLLSSNVGEVLIVFLALLIGFTDPATGAVVIPLTAIQLLWINILTDGLPAIALGVDPPSPNIMERRPRSPREKILSGPVLTEIWFVGIVIAIATLLLFWVSLPMGAVTAVTVAFTAIVVFEMVRVQSVRMKYDIGLLSNPKLIMAMAVSILLQLVVVYGPLVPGLESVSEIFTTTPLGMLEWLYIILAGAAIFFVIWLKERLLGTEI